MTCGCKSHIKSMPSLVYKRKNNQDSLSNEMANGNSFFIIHVYHYM